MKERGVVQIPLCFLAKSLENMSLSTLHISVKDGKTQGDVKLSMMQQLRMGWM